MGQYDDLLAQATQGASEAAAPSKYEDLLSKATGGGEKSSPPLASPASPNEALLNAAAPTDHTSLLDAAAATGPVQRDLPDTVGRAIARSWGQTKAMFPQLQAVYKEYNGREIL